MASPHVPPAAKRRLRKHYATLNPAEVKREIERVHKRLRKLTVLLRSGTASAPKPAANHPWRISGSKRKAS